MCVETYEVLGLDNARKEYEVEEYLKTLPYVSSVTADFIDNTVTIDWDEELTTGDTILDEIEYAGCQPSERVTGVIGKIRAKFA